VSTYARDQHRRMDTSAAEAEARDIAHGNRQSYDRTDGAHASSDQPGDIARPRRWRQDNVSGGRPAKVLLMTLSERTSAKGRRYFSGWLGKASVVAFESEPDKFGNPSWDVYVNEPQPRDGLAGGARARTYGQEGSR
jgi:hypothetical protein